MENPKSDQAPAENCSDPAPSNSNSGDDPSPPTTAESWEEKPEIEDPDILRQPKRRKNCPSALDKFDSVNSGSNFGFSFSFDSKFSGCSTPEVTPKFGSFNRVKPGSTKDPKSEETVLEEEDEDDDDDDEEKPDVVVEKNSMGLLSSVDGIKTVD
uniref:Putative ovule protein n=1 Tax=Solanum chacoense TaxID=4108 RepID=A0A0V0HAK9_SOLCH